MKIEYAGLKPIINEHGISFKDGKEDKFKYLKYAIDILNAINHEYKQKQVYSHVLDDKRLSSKEIIQTLLYHHKNLEETMKIEINSYLKHLDEEEESILRKELLSQIEKDTYINNLQIMRDYKIQRAKNKIFYFHCIDTIVSTILKYKIKVLEMPFNERFWHILQTIQGNLSLCKISSTLSTTNKEDLLKAVLKINIYK